jgi:hypothetical protein
MIDKTELQRLTRLRRLARQIVSSLPADLADEDRGGRYGDRPAAPMGKPTGFAGWSPPGR